MRSIPPVQFNLGWRKNLLRIKEQCWRGGDVSGFDFSFAGEVDQGLFSALCRTDKEALVSWAASTGNINITFKYPALCLKLPTKKPQEFLSPSSHRSALSHQTSTINMWMHLTMNIYFQMCLYWPVRSYSHLGVQILSESVIFVTVSPSQVYT